VCYNKEKYHINIQLTHTAEKNRRQAMDTRKTLERLLVDENARLRIVLGQIKNRINSRREISPELDADMAAIWSLADDALRRVPAAQ
jgi:hypothetical protein